MHADVEPLLAFHMDLGLAPKFFLLGYFRLAVWARGGVFSLSVDQVVSRSRGHALGELSAMIRHQFPARMLLGLRTDRDLYTIQRPVIRSVGGAKDQGVRLFRFLLVFLVGCNRLGESREHQDCKARSRVPAPTPFSSHRLLRPFLRCLLLRPRQARRLDSAPADAW